MAAMIGYVRDRAAFVGRLRRKLLPSEEALAATKGTRGAREAWEALVARGVIPAAWADAPERRFYRGMSGGGPQSFPQNVMCCVAIASEVANVLRAEQLALEVAERFARFGSTPLAYTLWRIDSALPKLVGKPIDPAVRAVLALPWEAGELDPAGVARRSFGPALTEAADVLLAEALWNVAAKRGWTLSHRGATVAIDEARNPFTPLCDLWELGFVPVSFGGGRALLFAQR